MRRRDGLPQDVAECHQALAWLVATVLPAWRQGEHLRPAGLVGNQIAGQQLIPGLTKVESVILSWMTSVPSL